MNTFESYIESKGYKLISGKKGEFNTYHNSQRLWSNNKIKIYIGLAIGGIFIHNLNERIPTKDFDIKLKEIESYKNGLKILS